MKGLPFIPEMAVAAIEGRKTQTRRIIKKTLSWADCVVAVKSRWGLLPMNGYYSGATVIDNSGSEVEIPCPYGKPGDRLCLLTTWAVLPRLDKTLPTEIPLSEAKRFFWHAGMGEKPIWVSKSRPGRFLPNHLRPLMPVFEIVSVRVERVQDITEDDAGAEGCNWKPHPTKCTEASNRAVFRDLWNLINEKRGYGWAVNPWVWVITFRKV